MTLVMLTVWCVLCDRQATMTEDEWLIHGDDCVFCGATTGLRVIHTDNDNLEAA